MTAPRTKYYSAQRQSPLYRFPRKVRDVIYDYYVREPEGYFFDHVTRKMLYEHTEVKPRRVIRLGLMISCRIAAEEMGLVALQKIHFTAGESRDDGGEYRGLTSRAGRLKCCMCSASS
jgi:hypothetical protein